MTLKASGKGISQAVRDTIPDWMDDETADLILAELPRSGRSARWDLRNRENWIRNQRRKDPGGGFRRTFDNKAIREGSYPNFVEIEVKTNSSDSMINYFAIKVNGKFVAGGDCRVASVFSGRASRSQDTAKYTYPPPCNRGIKLEQPKFRRFTQEEINQINDSIAVFDDEFSDR